MKVKIIVNQSKSYVITKLYSETNNKFKYAYYMQIMLMNISEVFVKKGISHCGKRNKICEVQVDYGFTVINLTPQNCFF